VANLENMGSALQKAFINTHTVVFPDVPANVQLQFVANTDGIFHRATPTGDVAAILEAGLQGAPLETNKFTFNTALDHDTQAHIQKNNNIIRAFILLTGIAQRSF